MCIPVPGVNCSPTSLTSLTKSHSIRSTSAQMRQKPYKKKNISFPGTPNNLSLWQTKPLTLSTQVSFVKECPGPHQRRVNHGTVTRKTLWKTRDLVAIYIVCLLTCRVYLCVFFHSGKNCWWKNDEMPSNYREWCFNPSPFRRNKTCLKETCTFAEPRNPWFLNQSSQMSFWKQKRNQGIDGWFANWLVLQEIDFLRPEMRICEPKNIDVFDKICSINATVKNMGLAGWPSTFSFTNRWLFLDFPNNVFLK